MKALKELRELEDEELEVHLLLHLSKKILNIGPTMNYNTERWQKLVLIYLLHMCINLYTMHLLCRC